MNWSGVLHARRAPMPLFQDLAKVARKDPTIGFFWCLATIHVVFWTVLATLTQPNLPAQTLELLTSGRELAWGYSTHPPMGVWLASAVSSIAAPSNWPVYLLAQLCGMVSVWSAWKLARKFLHPWTALCAAFVLLGGYSCTIAATSFTGDQLAGAFWSLSIYQFFNALTHERRRYWALTGLFLAMGLLSSYGTLLLIITMFVFTLVDDRARLCWDSSWPFLAGMAMVAMVMPHFVWLVNHQFLTVQAGIERSVSFAHHLIQPLSFLGTQLLCVIPVILILTPLVAWFSFEEPARTESSDDRDFARRYLLWMTCLPPAITFALSLMAGPSSGLFAGVTNWSYLGVAVLMWGHLSETRLSWRRSIIRIGTFVGLFAAAMVALNIMVPQIQRQGVATQFPGAELSQTIESIWKNFGYAGRTPVVAGPSELVRNAAWYAQHRGIKSYADLDPKKNPDVNDETLRREGGIIVWNLDDPSAPTPADLQRRFGNVTFVNPVDLHWKNDSALPAVQVGMAVVHPADVPATAGNPSAVTPANATYSSSIPTPAPIQSSIPQPASQPTGYAPNPYASYPAYPAEPSNVGSTTQTPTSSTVTPSTTIPGMTSQGFLPPQTPGTPANATQFGTTTPSPLSSSTNGPATGSSLGTLPTTTSPGSSEILRFEADSLRNNEPSRYDSTGRPQTLPATSLPSSPTGTTGGYPSSPPSTVSPSLSDDDLVMPFDDIKAPAPATTPAPAQKEPTTDLLLPPNYPAANFPLDGSTTNVKPLPSSQNGATPSPMTSPLPAGNSTTVKPSTSLPSSTPSTLEDLWSKFPSTGTGATNPPETPKPAPTSPSSSTIDPFDLILPTSPSSKTTAPAKPDLPTLKTPTESRPGLTEN